jgi:hypothetical protein
MGLVQIYFDGVDSIVIAWHGFSVSRKRASKFSSFAKKKLAIS